MKALILFCMLLLSGIVAVAAVLPVTDGLIIHLRADAIIGLSSGDPVNLWPDSATSDSVDGSILAVSGYSEPTWQANVIGAWPAVRFSSDLLSTAGTFALPDPGAGITILALFSGDSSGSAAQRLAQIGDAGGKGGQVVGLDVSTNTTEDNGGSGFRFNNGRAVVKASNPLTQGFHIAAWKMTQGAQHQTAAYYVDNTIAQTLDNVNNPTNTVTLPAAGNIFSVGTGVINGGFGAADYYTGDAVELLVYNRLLGLSEIEAVMNYLYLRYYSTVLLTDPVQLTLIEGQSGSVQVSLQRPPDAQVMVSLTDAEDTGQVAAEPATLLFTPDNWDQPRTVHITAVDDILLETPAREAAVLLTAASDDPDYDQAAASIGVVILENECGRWAYPPGDLNEDCRVDMMDLAVLARHWLWCDPMQDDACANLK